MQQQPSVVAARWAVLAMFFVNGAALASWIARIPFFQERFGLSTGELGFVLLGLSVGVVGSLAFASGLVARFGSRHVTTWGGLAQCATLPLLAVLPSPVALAAGLALFGGWTSTMDIAMNTHALEVERRRGQPLMSSFHAGWSVGGFAGAGLGAAAAALGFGVQEHFAIAGVLFAAVTLVASRFLFAHVEGEKRSGEPVFQVPARAIWPLGAIALFVALGEGSMSDWSAVYLRRVAGASPEVAALGFAVFSIMMTTGRITGDALRAHLGPRLVVSAGGALAGAGLLAAVVAPQPVIILIGFAAAGLGLANGVPVAFSAAGNRTDISPSRGVAGVATIGYAASLAGPPVLGQIAQFTSLRLSLALVALLAATIFVFAGALEPRPRSRA